MEIWRRGDAAKSSFWRASAKTPLGTARAARSAERVPVLAFESLPILAMMNRADAIRRPCESWRRGWDSNPRDAFTRPQVSNLFV